MMIQEMLGNWMAWLMLHLMTNSLAFIKVILIVWWEVFLIRFECKWIYTMEVVMLFLILVSDITMIVLELESLMKAILSSFWIWVDLVSLLLQSAWWKEKQLGKMLINLYSGEDSLFMELKEEKIPLRWLFTSIIELLIFNLCLEITLSNER